METLSKYVFGTASPSEFMAGVIGRHYHIYRDASQLWRDVSLVDMERYLNQCEGHLHTFIRVLDKGNDLHIPTEARFTQETQKAYIDRAYAGGATVKVEDYDSRHPVVAAMCRELEAFIGGNVYAMSFLTPAGQRGFPVHFDVADALIIQLEGSKHWKIYDKVIDSPTHALNYRMSQSAEPAPIDEFVLNKGDVLYIPSGVPHSALCTTEHSLHLSVGLNVWKPYQLLNFAVSLLTESLSSLRSPIYKNDADNERRISAAIDEFCSKLKDVEPRKLLDSFETSFNANRPEVNGQAMTNFSLAQAITQDTRVSRNHLKFAKLKKSGDKMRIFPSSTIRPGKSLLPASAYIEIPDVAETEIVALLESSAPLKISDIPGGLDIPSKLVLVQQLLRQGILSVAAH
ncbi:JmjC domain-containing protein [Paraburkholderia megapolitana]|uniref:Cupin superfamily protein n=1 Tax=Paraburkholderia megapolitana TaxID=420953 RepID=A0A1I3WAJ8_9BURK|nr:cupin domain-containing protein [Paraburkholderia megapolitana]QDQ82221.1 hypothetical protein FNZ07_13045 [Paraburkholderia megapolitana]SFK04420.1 Cupin superfamily protein [Paraburkholderia megapolitana]